MVSSACRGKARDGPCPDDHHEETPLDLPEDLIALLRRPSPGWVATAMPDVSPQLTQTWVDTDGANVLINTV